MTFRFCQLRFIKKNTRVFYLSWLIFNGHFKNVAQILIYFFTQLTAKIVISDSDFFFFFSLKSRFGARKLNLWILVQGYNIISIPKRICVGPCFSYQYWIFETTPYRYWYWCYRTIPILILTGWVPSFSKTDQINRIVGSLSYYVHWCWSCV